MKRLLLVDIDGVLADCSHRLHYLEAKDYDSFYGPEMMNDSLIESGKALFQALYSWSDKDRLVYLTSRPQRTMNMTLGWLALQGFPTPGSEYGPEISISMRPDGNYSKSSKMKVKQLDEFYKALPENTEFGETFFIDDDPQNVEEVVRAFPWITGLTFGTERM